jgi:YetA-like protein
MLPVDAPDRFSPPARRLSLEITSPLSGGPQPVTTGVCLPQGEFRQPVAVTLHGPQGTVLPVQSRTLALWPDDSARWLLLDFLLPLLESEVSSWTLLPGDRSAALLTEIRTEQTASGVVVETGAARFEIGTGGVPFFSAAWPAEGSVPGRSSTALILTDAHGKSHSPRRVGVRVVEAGPLRVTVALDGELPELRLRARLHFFAGTGLVKAEVTLHNPRRARHRGGLWDLGDPGSILFRELSLECGIAGDEPPEVSYRAEPGAPLRTVAGGKLEVYQDSSGGDNWQSPNHVNRKGEIPCRFRGYRVRDAAGETVGTRSQPTLTLCRGSHGMAVALAEFWQNFPRALEVQDGRVKVGLFPGQAADLFEMQGGEQKTHTVWFNFGPSTPALGDSLLWVARPAVARPSPPSFSQGPALPDLDPSPGPPLDRLERLLAEALEGERSIPVNRERVDEYGWRNFGDVFADHERAYYTGTAPLISHYNNQFDMVMGFILHFLRTGDRRWFDLSDALARHVVDIDVYHTQQDRWAYNGGLFWHTDHYRTAHTSTHRCYSQANRPAGQPYGGGPANEHNYTSGLLLYHYLTGNPEAAGAVVELADWVIHMDDGGKTWLGLVDDGPTGLASSTKEPGYHGPGRGAGNSINALLDAWTLTGRRDYLAFAETLVRRCIHPADDIAARDLLDVEARWSYTIFLAILAKYLDLKAAAGETDRMYAYAQASLTHYAAWMVQNERPYFDQVEKLEFPTEVWAAQDMRKANVFRRAARHADEPLRSALIERGDSFAERAWQDLLRFETRTHARSIAIMMIEGLSDCGLRRRTSEPAPRAAGPLDFGTPQPFVPQRQRVLARARTAWGFVGMMGSLLDPLRWVAYRKHARQRRRS